MAKRMTTEGLIKEALSREYFQPIDGEVAIPVTYLPGKGHLVLAVGDNASGKSFFRRVIQGLCSLSKLECIHLSMEGRRNVAYHVASCFVYGSEDYQSTGQNSTETVLGAIRTTRGRENPHVIFWDEPDFGLSESWSASMGIEIANGMTTEVNPDLVAAFVVTHSRPLMRPLIDLNPHVLIFDEGSPTSLQEYLDRPLVIRPLQDLKDLSHQRFKRIQKVLDLRKAKKR
jgi:hypothetical protein